MSPPVDRRGVLLFGAGAAAAAGLSPLDSALGRARGAGLRRAALLRFADAVDRVVPIAEPGPVLMRIAATMGDTGAVLARHAAGLRALSATSPEPSAGGTSRSAPPAGPPPTPPASPGPDA